MSCFITYLPFFFPITIIIYCSLPFFSLFFFLLVYFFMSNFSNLSEINKETDCEAKESHQRCSQCNVPICYNGDTYECGKSMVTCCTDGCTNWMCLDCAETRMTFVYNAEYKCALSYCTSRDCHINQQAVQEVQEMEELLESMC